ncbi:MAG: nicotinate phosphoribosyltransferase [Candidatus Buchananbacteria bacterium]|nr:nicotinate phosphoribosyltransferase [Candidatus Buchananbacteria bacterium]
MRDQPIITSLLDTDFYKFTMGMFAFLKYRGVPVKYAFKNRTTKVALTKFIDEGELREQLDAVRQLRFSKSELHYLCGTSEYGQRMFTEDYLQFLADLQLPQYDLAKDGDQYQLEFAGPWEEAIYWETLALSIVNELYFRNKIKQDGLSRFEQELMYAEAKIKLANKITLIKQHPDITITDFGTRRRFSRDWQYYIVEVLKAELGPQFLGTSNVKAAMDQSLLPMGTSAHELPMVMSGIMHGSDDDIRASHNQALVDWWDLYGWALSIALTDTYGSDFFFRDFNSIQARRWKGLREDSGNPFALGEKAIAFYQGHDIDPMEKLVIFSDGLDVEIIIEIADYFRGRIKVSFGWGTTLTNDLLFKALSLVVKVVEANGHGTVKLSDNLAKAMGQPNDIERFKRIFGHTVTLNETCLV